MKYKTWYCPALGPDFNDGDFLALWNWEVVSPPPDDPTKEGARVLGYAQTFPNTVSLDPTNYNVSLVQPPTIQVSFGIYRTESLADRVLFADVVMSQTGQNNVAQRGTYQYSGITGGSYPKLHRTAHLNGKLPAGGNIGYLDGHVKWHKWDAPVMTPRSTANPVFWW